MKNLKVTINRSAGVKSMKYCLGRKKICADVAFALKTQTARKNENTQFPVEKSAAE